MSTPPATVEPEYTMTGTVETVLSQFSPKPASQRFTLQNHKLLRVSLGPGVLGDVLRSARARIAGPGGADRLGADQIQRVHRALADRDRRARAWEFAGLRIEADTAAFRIAPAAPRP